MTHADFQIGTEFYTAAGKWRCTDVGTRTIVAIRLDPVDALRHRHGHPLEKRTLTEAQAQAEGWFNGPPFAVGEHVFDEYTLEGCWAEPNSQ